ncbi:hypothetical protein T484DRAFT_1863728, partial [Baffinella frigidus]
MLDVWYVDVLFASMDVTSRDQSPDTYYSVYNSLYVVAFLIVGSLFTDILNRLLNHL